MSDRDLILGRVRAAIADVPAEDAVSWDPTRAKYHRSRELPLRERTELFIDRCREYAATVTACADTPVAIAAAVDAILLRHDASTVAVPGDLDPGWLDPSRTYLADQPPLAVTELDSCDGAVTGAAMAIADTGTIVLDSGPGQGRRVLTLVPDLYVCVVRAEQIYTTVPEAISALAASFRAGTPITFISGPSATSDIELNRVEGVHGPRRLEVVVAG